MDYRGFVGPSYTSQSPLAAGERLVNWYVEQLESPSAKGRAALYPTPGLEVFASPATGSRIRALFGQAGRTFAVSSSDLYEVFADGTTTKRGSMLEDTDPSTLVTNGDGGDQLFATSGGTGYILDLTTNVFTSVVTGATMGGMVGGYFVALDTDTSTLRISDLLDGLTWDSLQIAQRSTQPDPWKSMLIAYNEIWLLGEDTSEVWFLSGAFPFPFEPRPGAVIQQGIAAPFSAAVLEGTVIWLAGNQNGDRTVVQAQGYTPKRISTHAVEYALSTYARVDDATAMVMQDQGHFFYLLNFPSASATWVFDLATGLWHERGTWISTKNQYDAWHPQMHTFAFGQHLVGDRESATIYRASIDLGWDAGGAPLRRWRRGPHLWDANRRLFPASFELFLEPGVGLVSGQGSDPTVLLRQSSDGGKTWGSARSRSAGKLGEYGTRVMWQRCSAGRDVVFDVVVSDPIPWRLTGAEVQIRGARAAPQSQGAAA